MFYRISIQILLQVSRIIVFKPRDHSRTLREVQISLWTTSGPYWTSGAPNSYKLSENTDFLNFISLQQR